MSLLTLVGNPITTSTTDPTGGMVPPSGLLTDLIAQGYDKILPELNRYVPLGMKPYEPEEIAILSFVAADNLLNRSYRKFAIPALSDIAKLLKSRPALLDHDSEESLKGWGRVWGTWVYSSPTAPMEVLDQAGNLEMNSQIVRDEGFHRCYFSVFVQASNQRVEDFRFARLQEVSIGGFTVGEYQCPLCIDASGQHLNFSNPKCAHFIPDPWWGRDGGDAPYAIRVNVLDLLEVSAVATPGIPGAGVITASN